MTLLPRITSIMTKRVHSGDNNVDRDGVVSYATVTTNIMFLTKNELKVPIIGHEGDGLLLLHNCTFHDVMEE